MFWAAVGAVVSALPFALRFGVAVWLGMIAPLVVAVTSWMLAEHWYRKNPARMTQVMMTAFAGKLVFFGAYVGLVVGILDVAPIPFAVSFTGYYIALHMLEALWLKRLFA